MNYQLLDTYNSYFRSIHTASRSADIEEKVAFALHCTLQGIAAAWREQKSDHLVVCLEGRSWRKDFYKPYKANRDVARAASTEKEQEEGKLLFEALGDLIEFFQEKTNVTVMRHPNLEADDLIAGWTQYHLDDKHVINSTDTDYYQLLSENVSQYSGVAQEMHTINGIFDKKGKRVLDKKTKLPKVIPDPKFILFEKCLRGDPGDNVFSAYPGVRTKGSKNKVGIIEAYADRDGKGYNWNNLMLQRWVDHNKVEHRVLDDFNRNVTLIDLTAQPTDVKLKLVDTIKENAVPKSKGMVGAQFLKFCGKYGLDKLSQQPAIYADILSAKYPS